MNATDASNKPRPVNRRRQFVGGSLAVLSALGYSTLAIFAKGAYAGGLEVLDALSLRFLVATVILWAYALWRRDRLSLLPSRRHLLLLAAWGAGIYGPLAICFFQGVQQLPASLAEMIFFTYPLQVTVLSVLILHERCTWRRGLILALGLVGCGFLLDAQASGWHLAGVLWVLAGSSLYALHITISQRFLEQIEARVTALYVVTFAAAFLVVLRPPWEALAHLQAPLLGLASVAGLGLIATAGGMLLFFLAVERIGSWRAAIIGVCEPLGTVILASLLLGETLSTTQLVGGALVLLAALLVNLVP
ncbi:MAG: DMT family transporter [Chloroflexi bacterium]|nr:DMT family transporter [Chloroflexota bacterium]MBU1750094.1 DMT family transporter [Chloroflexota bacterium]